MMGLNGDGFQTTRTRCAESQVFALDLRSALSLALGVLLAAPTPITVGDDSVAAGYLPGQTLRPLYCLQCCKQAKVSLLCGSRHTTAKFSVTTGGARSEFSKRPKRE
jgi:hypothetical protein